MSIRSVDSIERSVHKTNEWLKDLDAELGRLDHRRRTLPETEEADRLEARDAALRDEISSLEAQDRDLGREQVKAEGDVEQVRARVERDRARLDAGQVSSPRELENLQSEIASLARRHWPGWREDLQGRDFETAAGVARAADELGFDSIWLYDHLQTRDGDPERVLECWTTLAALAREGHAILTSVPSCTLMFKQELPLLFPDDPDVAAVAEAIAR